ncbi:MAG: ATPase domain-containing protein [Anaerolineae bacterium]|nr:flagellar accessory protein FlaH [Anaerolineae bacterium]
MTSTTSGSPFRTVISTKNTELDARLGGGVPIGSLTLIEGTSGSGKSVLSQQIIWGALMDGFIVSLFTTENTVKSLMRQMESIDLDVRDYLLLSRFKAFSIELSQLGERAPQALSQSMHTECNRPRLAPNVLVIDSFTSGLTDGKNRAGIISFFEECKRLCAKDISIFVTVHSRAVDEELLDLLRSMSDANVKLRSEQDGQRLVKVLEVGKIRGAASTTGAIVGFDVEPGWGMRVIPISKARG